MGDKNHKVNTSDAKIRIGKGAQIRDNTILTCMDVFEKIKEETEKDWELEAKGRVHRSVLEHLRDNDKNYSVFKAYPGGNPKKSKGKEEITH